MHQTILAGLLALAARAAAQTYQGFNYGSTYTDGSAIGEAGYEAQFNAAKHLVGTSGFTSARLFTTIQAGTTNTPSEAIQAAINTDTTLLLGIWGSGGEGAITNELAALKSAVAAHGSSFVNLVAAISVGSEDLYRISPTGIINKSGIGASPTDIVNYINQVKQSIAGDATLKALSGKLVGHVDTWTAWVNGSNDAVIAASDFIGMDAYPYFQNTMTNDINDGYSLFFSAYDQTVAAAGNKPVWVTETGWPVSGATENLAAPSTANAKTYWDQVGCGRLFGKINTWWYTLQDAFPTTPNPSFGVVGAGSSANNVPTTPLYDLSCSGNNSPPPAGSSVAPPSSNPAASAQAGGNNGAERQGQAEQSALAAGGSPGPAEVTQHSTVVATITSCPGGCVHTAPGPVVQPTTLVTKPAPAPSSQPQQGSCPANLNGQYEYPHLIVPISKAGPDTAQGTSFNGTISPSVSSIFNFDIPAADSGKTCTVIFLLPNKNQLTTSSFSLSGAGGLDAALLQSPAVASTTYNNRPAVSKDLGGPASVTPGNSYVIASGACAAGSRVGYQVSATGSLDLEFFQDYNPSPIGLYLSVC